MGCLHLGFPRVVAFTLLWSESSIANTLTPVKHTHRNIHISIKIKVRVFDSFLLSYKNPGGHSSLQALQGRAGWPEGGASWMRGGDNSLSRPIWTKIFRRV